MEERYHQNGDPAESQQYARQRAPLHPLGAKHEDLQDDGGDGSNLDSQLGKIERLCLDLVIVILDYLYK